MLIKNKAWYVESWLIKSFLHVKLFHAVCHACTSHEKLCNGIVPSSLFRIEVMKLNAEAWSFHSEERRCQFNSPSPLGMDKPPVLVQFSLVHGGVGNLV